jgi:rubrerythrin
MSKTPGAPKVTNLNDLLAVAYQIEIDAVDRYKLLADQMETHNNPELVKIFRDLARAEGIHGEEIRRMAGDFDVAARAREIAKFEKSESPEEAESRTMRPRASFETHRFAMLLRMRRREANAPPPVFLTGPG